MTFDEGCKADPPTGWTEWAAAKAGASAESGNSFDLESIFKMSFYRNFLTEFHKVDYVNF
jgi:hypothetical protein